MNANNPVAPEDFRASFERIKTLILEEWPKVEAEPLTDTEGNYDDVIDVVAKATEHSKALVKRQVAEIAQIAIQEDRTLQARLQAIVENLEERTNELQRHVREDMVPQAEEKVKENLWTSLLGALGFGILLGLILGLSARGR